MGLHLEGTMRKQVQGRAMGMRKSYQLRGGADFTAQVLRKGWEQRSQTLCFRGLGCVCPAGPSVPCAVTGTTSLVLR